MFKKFLATLGLLTVMAIPSLAQERNKVYGWCQQGGTQVVSAGIPSTNRVQGSFPTNCQITVFNAGTVVNATIFSDSAGTPLGNPFTANSTTGFWQFYVVAGSKVDVRIQATGLTTYTIGDIWVAPTAFSGITGSGTLNTIPKWASASSLTNSLLTDNGSLITSGGSVDLVTNNLRIEVTNDTGSGTTANRLAVLTGAPSRAVTAPAATTSGVLGIVVAGAGTSGSAQIAVAGRASCVFDAATVAGQYVIPSLSSTGMCSAVATPAAGTAAIGLVLSTNAGAGTYEVFLFGPDSRATSFLASSGEILWSNGGAIDGVSNSIATTLGEVRFASSVRTSGGATRYFAILAPQDTTLTADTESVGIQLGGFSNLSSVNRQFTAGGGAFTTQREIVVAQPTYSFTSNDTITNVATFAIVGAPAPGPNATFTNSYSFWVQGGLSRFDSKVYGDVGSGTTAVGQLMAFGGLYDSSSSSTTTSGVAATTLYTLTFLGNTMATNGDVMIAKVFGRISQDGGTNADYTFSWVLDGVTLHTEVQNTNSNFQHYNCEVIVQRTGATTANVYISWNFSRYGQVISNNGANYGANLTDQFSKVQVIPGAVVTNWTGNRLLNFNATTSNAGAPILKDGAIAIKYSL